MECCTEVSTGMTLGVRSGVDLRRAFADAAARGEAEPVDEAIGIGECCLTISRHRAWERGDEAGMH